MPAHPSSHPDRKPEVERDHEGDTSKSLMTLHRRAKIVELVQRRGAVRVGELSEIFGVSEVTIRGDLARLDGEGALIRDHGGAIAKPEGEYVTTLQRVDERSTLNLDAKRRIGQAAAALVKPGGSIMMDAGTTVVEMARHLGKIAPLSVVTNALNVAMELGAGTDADIILLGGALSRTAGSTVGPLAERSLHDFSVGQAFLGTQAVDLDHGLTDSTPEIAQVKRSMIQSADEVILLTDSSKWGRSGFIKVAPLSEIDTIISDTKLPLEAREAIERLGIRLILV